MEFKVDQRQPVRRSFPSLEPSHLWVIGLAVDDDVSPVAPRRRQAGDWAECECPDDCLRDHENE